VVALSINGVNALEQNGTVNQTTQTQQNTTSGTSNVTSNTTGTSTKSTSTFTDTKVSYTYNVNIPYTVKVKVAVKQAYKVKVRTYVKKYYYSHGKYRVKYVAKYTYVTKYKTVYKWQTVTKYKKETRTGYAYLSDYLKETKNCQVSNSKIQSLSYNLTCNASTNLEKATNIFNWVRDNLDYSFYYCTKNGAVNTLNTKVGNCCDHTHLVVALARAAGIPARYMHGDCTFNSGNVYGHVWGQLYVDGKWYSADATSYSNTLGTIKNWNTGTAFVHNVYASLPW
jgi:transglutaminase-like putative cysteine protease